MNLILVVLCFFREFIVKIVDLFVVSIGLIIKIWCWLIFLGNLIKYLIGWKVFLLWYILIWLILVVGIRFKKLLIILIFVCKIGIIVNFFLVNCFCIVVVIGVWILIFFKGKLWDIL